jgi:predicted secreted Zn-dependent protease
MIGAAALAAAQFQDVSQQVSTVPVMRAPQTVVVAPTAALARFSDLPNVSITYYDVTGHDVPEIHKSIATHAPRDPKSNQPIPATSSWSVKAAMKSLAAGKRCTITRATLEFSGTATLPRLIVDKDTPPKLVAVWDRYVAELESRQAAQLRFAYDRLGEVEHAVAGTRCDKANAAADGALARIKAQQLAAQDRDKKAMPRLEEPES